MISMAQTIQDISAKGIIGARWVWGGKHRVGKVTSSVVVFYEGWLISRSQGVSAGLEGIGSQQRPMIPTEAGPRILMWTRSSGRFLLSLCSFISGNIQANSGINVVFGELLLAFRLSSRWQGKYGDLDFIGIKYTYTTTHRYEPNLVLYDGEASGFRWLCTQYPTKWAQIWGVYCTYMVAAWTNLAMAKVNF